MVFSPWFSFDGISAWYHGKFFAMLMVSIRGFNCMVSIDFLGTSTIFSTLHGSLWLGKDEGSIMESAESCGTIV